MAEKIVSPGVFTKEIDETFLPAAIADIGAVIIGPTVKGPANIPIVVNSYSEFVARFGDTFESGSTDDKQDYTYLTSLAAKNYLKNSDTLTVVRVLAGSYSGASATISGSTDPSIVGAGFIGANGGTKAVGSIKFFANGGSDGELAATGSNLQGVSASFWYNSSKVDFILQTSGSHENKANSATTIYVATGSVKDTGGAGTGANVAASFRDSINNSSSLHNLPISASSDGLFHLGITSSLFGDFEPPTPAIGAGRIAGREGFLSGSLQIITGSYMTGSAMSGSQLMPYKDIPGTLRLANGSNPTPKTPFKLHTIADGTVMNNRASGTIEGTRNLLHSGSKHNVRWEITNVNAKRGTFSLVIRSGNDTHKSKNILETWNNLTLDPNDKKSYIASVIGDSYLTVNNSGTNDVYLSYTGQYPNKSKYVRVEVLEQTAGYLDDNGNISINAFSASLPSFHSGSNSGSFGGSFIGGTDGTVQHPKVFYENITATNVQGLDPTTAASGKDAYIDILNLLSNQDEYDFNLLLLPGIIGAEHSAVASKAIDVCEDRGDCFVLLDPVLKGKTPDNAVTQAKTRNSSYAAMYWPWVQVPELQTGENVWVPPSVAIGGMYAFNDKVAQPWFAPAGLNRGTLDTVVQAERKLTQSNRDTLYDSNVNPVATFPGTGVTVWGQKTLQKKASALDRVNVRRLLIKVKKFIASSSRFLVFEQNNAKTRQRFLGIANPFLEQVQAQSGLDAFRVVMDESNNTPDLVDRNILYGQIFLQPTRTAEFIVLDFTIQPTGATFED